MSNRNLRDWGRCPGAMALARAVKGYERRFTLSKELDATRISAELTHGVLRMRIPKAMHAQPRKGWWCPNPPPSSSTWRRSPAA